MGLRLVSARQKKKNGSANKAYRCFPPVPPVGALPSGASIEDVAISVLAEPELPLGHRTWHLSSMLDVLFQDAVPVVATNPVLLPEKVVRDSTIQGGVQ